MSHTDDLGDRMKMYEQAEAGRRLMPGLPVCARSDGRSFSTWTRGFERPYDTRLSETMVETTRELVEATGACIGYTQSDEISLVWYEPRGPIPFFEGKTQKLVSVLASMATAFFNRHGHRFPERHSTPAQFDCRVWNVPTLAEAANVLLWRELDATKNSVSMAARAYYSHKQVHGLSSSDMQELLHQKGVNWNDYPAFFKRGTFVRAARVTRAFTADELSKLPPKHHAHTNPDLAVSRRVIACLDLPPLRQVQDRVAVLFPPPEAP